MDRHFICSTVSKASLFTLPRTGPLNCMGTFLRAKHWTTCGCEALIHADLDRLKQTLWLRNYAPGVPITVTQIGSSPRLLHRLYFHLTSLDLYFTLLCFLRLLIGTISDIVTLNHTHKIPPAHRIIKDTRKCKYCFVVGMRLLVFFITRVFTLLYQAPRKALLRYSPPLDQPASKIFLMG